MAPLYRASMMKSGVGRSGSPMPRLVMSMPFAATSALALSMAAKRYGGTVDRRSARLKSDM